MQTAMRIIDYFDMGVELDPDRDCLVMDGVGKSYRQVQLRTYQIGNALIAEGLTPLSKVAVLSPNDLSAFECVLGILRAECVWSPVNARNSARENAQILQQFDVELLFWHTGAADQMAEIREHCPNIRRFICIDAAAQDSVRLDDWLTDDVSPTPERGKSPDELAVLLSTGGTTGRPKGVMWSTRTWQTLVANFHVAFPHKQAVVNLAAAPMSHAAGPRALLLMAIGATTIILPSFDAEAVMKAIQQHRVTNLFLPPTAIYMMLSHPKVRSFDYSSLEYFTYSAAPMSVDKLREAIDIFGPIMSSGYGQVESPSTISVFPPSQHVDAEGRPNKLGSCGRPAMFNRVAIMDDDGHVLGPGEHGEIVVRGSLVMMGYYKDSAATEQASRFGWHHTGDIGYRDEDGYLFISDRKKDMIITGGFNVYSSEVEQVLLGNPAVQDCAVIGVPDDKWGEAVKAIVQLRVGSHVTPDELMKEARQTLGGVKTPKTIEIWPTLPRSAAGKVSKKDIRDKFWEGRDKRI